MTALTQNISRTYELGDINAHLVEAGAEIFKGAAIGDNGNGYVRSLQGGDAFRGFAEEAQDNSEGSDGDIRVRVRGKGAIVLDVTGLTITHVGTPVYATDDNSFTTADSGASAIGVVTRYIEDGKGLVAFDVSIPSSGLDITGGSTS